MSTAKIYKRKPKTGLSWYETTIVKDNYVVNYTFHGSSFVHAKEIPVTSPGEVTTFLESLRK